MTPSTITKANRSRYAMKSTTEQEQLARFAELRDSYDPFEAEQAMRLADQLVERYMPLVRAAVRRWRAKMPGGIASIGFDDLKSAGAGGLWKALLYFDPARGVPFARFASIHIHGEINEEVRRADFVQDKVRREIQRSWRAVSSLENDLNRAATEEEAAQASGVSVERYRNLCLWDLRSLTAELTEPVERFLKGSSGADPLERLCAIEEALEGIGEDDQEIKETVEQIGIAVENVKGYFSMEGAA